MKRKQKILVVALIATLNLQSPLAPAQGTAFTYQGRLSDGANAANGIYDLRFALFDAASAGAQQGNLLTNTATVASNGLFTVTLDFGSQFPGASRWLEIAVRTNGGGAFTTLTPRQALTATPYAVTAGNVTGGIAAAQISGTVSLAQLPVSVVTNGASGVNISGTFTGNGGGVTNMLLTSLNSGGGVSPMGGFMLAASPGVGACPESMVAADVNGDGRVDLITVNACDNTLSILTNDGRGGFSLAASPGVGNNPLSMAAADVNGDSKVDLISANFNSDSLSVLTNNGTGGFALAYSLGVGSGPIFVLATDINGDGKVDLISANYSAYTLSVLTNSGSTFGPPLSLSVGSGNLPLSVAVMDVNGDGKPDFISACENGSLVLLPSFLNSWFFPTSITVGGPANSVLAADVNGDGRTDLITGTFGGSLSVLTNNGSGGFGLAASPSVASQTESVVAADVNGDGKVDLLSASYSGKIISVLTNAGSGGFGLAAYLGVGSFAFCAVATDVNGDRQIDLISANADNTLSVLINRPAFQGVFSGDFLGVNVRPPYGVSFGAQWRQMINLWNTNYGIGVQFDTEYFRSPSGFAWFQGGAHNDGQNNPGGGSVLMTLNSAGLTVNGTFVSASDRNLKENFQPVDAQEVLRKVATLPLSRWNYKADKDSEHIGPMAQDFHAAFGVGPDDKHITTVDEGGVALAAIQGLNEKLEATRVENAELKARLEKLERLLEHPAH